MLFALPILLVTPVVHLPSDVMITPGYLRLVTLLSILPYVLISHFGFILFFEYNIFMSTSINTNKIIEVNPVKDIAFQLLLEHLNAPLKDSQQTVHFYMFGKHLLA